MLSSSFGAEQRISEPLSALAFLTGRHREIKHARPKRPKIYYNRPNSGPTESQRYREGWYGHYLARFRTFEGTYLACFVCTFVDFYLRTLVIFNIHDQYEKFRLSLKGNTVIKVHS